MRAFKTLPPAYVAYRVALIALVLALLTGTTVIVVGEFSGWWQEVLSVAGRLRRAWTDLGWSPV